MPGHARILSGRRDPGGLGDLAVRRPFIGRQRVRRRWVARRIGVLLRWLGSGLGALLLLSAPLALIHWLHTTSWFTITRVEIRGLDWLTEAEVREAAGIGADQNLVALDGEGVVQRLERLPRVKRARLIRELPNRVVLVIEEREPFALAVSGGRLYWLDEEGHVLGPEPRAVAPGLPLITGHAGQQLLDGPPAAADRARTAVAVLRTVLRSRSSLEQRVSEIDVGRADEGPLLYTVDGIEVKLGTEAWEERLGRLEAVLAQLDAQPGPVESIDLRFRDQVVFKPKR